MVREGFEPLNICLNKRIEFEVAIKLQKALAKIFDAAQCFFMPIEQVKLNTKALKCPVPATLKISRGKIGLYRGEHARVEIWTSKPKPLCLCRKIGDETKRKFFGLDEITLANDTARHYEIQARANGLNFGTISDDEKRALMIWRDFVFSETKAGNPPRRLSEIVAELVEREAHKDETPPLREVVFKFIEAKDAAGGISQAYRARLKNRLERLAKFFREKRIGEITETELKSAILKLSRGRDGAPPAPKTQKHWIEAAKELFAWFYARENATRRPAEKLNNPLELAAAPKIEKTREPEIISPAAARAILADLLANDLELLPAVAVQMFCGVRNAEALRLRWKDLKDGEFHLSCAITKTKIARAVPVPANLRAWIDAYAAARGNAPAAQDLIFPFNDTPAAALAGASETARAARMNADYHARSMTYSRAILAAEKRTGIHKPQNAFRHTAVSALAVMHGQNLAADYCGHSIRTQGVNYRGLMSKQEAADYFGIVPPAGDGKAIAFSRERAKAGATGARDGQRDAAQGETTPDAAAGA